MTQVSEEVRARNRAVWSAGDWDKMSAFVAPVGPKLLDSIGVGPRRQSSATAGPPCEDLRKLFDEVNERTDGTYAADMEYLQTIGRRPA